MEDEGGYLVKCGAEGSIGFSREGTVSQITHAYCDF